jgi:dihydrofolate synthase / folylpolyglutamate synthase
MEHLMLQVVATPHEKLHIVLGMVADKDVNNTLAVLPKAAFYYFCQADIPRALEASALAEKAGEHKLRGVVVAGVNEALALARRKAAADDMILITGSTFVVADLDQL